MADDLGLPADGMPDGPEVPEEEAQKHQAGVKTGKVSIDSEDDDPTTPGDDRCN
jgi:hypothetical protein